MNTEFNFSYHIGKTVHYGTRFVSFTTIELIGDATNKEMIEMLHSSIAGQLGHANLIYHLTKASTDDLDDSMIFENFYENDESDNESIAHKINMLCDHFINNEGNPKLEIKNTPRKEEIKERLLNTLFNFLNYVFNGIENTEKDNLFVIQKDIETLNASNVKAKDVFDILFIYNMITCALIHHSKLDALKWIFILEKSRTLREQNIEEQNIEINTFLFVNAIFKRQAELKERL